MKRAIIYPEKYTAYNFLIKFYEFKAMVANQEEWNETALKDNPPRFYRFLELKALMKAFDIGDDLVTDFVQLGFLNNRSTADVEPIYQDMADYEISEENQQRPFRVSVEKLRQSGVLGVKMTYASFLRFSEKLRNILDFNGGWIGTGGFVSTSYTINKTSNILASIDTSKLKEIEDLLTLIIAPKQQSFTKEELIKNYNFPDVDLESIDLDWL